MKPTELNARSLPQLNSGNAGDNIDIAIAELMSDIVCRTEDAGKRTMKIELDLTPLPGDQVEVVLRVTTKRPNLKTAKHNGKVKVVRGSETVLQFVPDNPQNGEQPTLTPDKE